MRKFLMRLGNGVQFLVLFICAVVIMALMAEIFLKPLAPFITTAIVFLLTGAMCGKVRTGIRAVGGIILYCISFGVANTHGIWPAMIVWSLGIIFWFSSVYIWFRDFYRTPIVGTSIKS